MDGFYLYLRPINLFLNFELSRSVSSIHLKLQPGRGQNIKFELSKLKLKGNFDFSSLGPNKQIFKSFPLLMESVWKWKSLEAQMVKNLPSLQETWVWSLGWEKSPGEGSGIHSSILDWRIPWAEKPDGRHSMGPQSELTEWLTPILADGKRSLKGPL